MTTALTKVRLFLKRLAQFSGIGRLVWKLWNTYEHVVFSYYVRRNLRGTTQDAEIDPFYVFWISPNHIKAGPGRSFDFLTDTGKIVGGTWDDNHGEQITDSSLYRWFEQRFHDGCAWEETDRYVHRVSKIESGRNKRYSTVSEFEDKLRSYDRLYREFDRGNYRLQSELADEQVSGQPGDGGRALFPSLTDHTLMRHEIAVNVGRDGKLYRNDGRHRLFLALVADLEEIPVRIVVRHAKWQSFRNEIARTIDDALKAGVPPGDIREHVEQAFADDLQEIFLGLEHPDLEVIFERRLKTDNT